MRTRMRYWLVVAVAVIAFVGVYSIIQPLDERLADAQGDTIVALELAFTPARAASVVKGWESFDIEPSTARTLVDEARKAIHWDWALIAAYLLLMLAIRALILRSDKSPPPNWARLWLFRFPILVAVLDALENLGMYFLLASDNQEGLLFSVTAPTVAVMAASKFFFVFLFIVAVSKSLHPNLKVLFLPRFSLLMLAVGAVAIVVPQWQEVLLAVAEEDWPLSFWLGFAAFIASLTTWYSARVLYMLRLSDSTAPTAETAKTIEPSWEDVLKPLDTDVLRDLSDNTTARWTKTWYPRVLGFLVVPLTTVGLARAADGDVSRMATPLYALGLAWIVYMVFVIYRRWFSCLMYKKLSDPWLIEKLEFLDMCGPDGDFGIYDRYRNLPWFTRRVLMVLAALNVVAFLSVWYNPLWVQNVGSAAVVLGAVGLMVPVGNWLVYWGVRHGLPVLLLLLALAGLFSLYNDNHWVRLSPQASSTNDAQFTGPLPVESGIFASLKDYARAWAEERADEISDNGDIPLFIVSTEGGGIRAAYWTAVVLASLQDQDRRFANHLFAISGVSGGSLGGAVFASQVASGLPAESRSFRDHADAVLQRDFLAPTLATLLFPDLLQRFLPWSLFNDRAITMETSWEDGWEKTWEGTKSGNRAEGKRFAEPFADLWRDMAISGESTRVPLLFLNSTVVETGNRLIMHPLDFDKRHVRTESLKSREAFADVFKDAIDGRSALGSSVPLSTAVHISARFTYVSPAGSVQNITSGNARRSERNRRWIRLVDGGYFENSASVTARELLATLERYQAEAESDADNKSKAGCFGQCEDNMTTSRQDKLPPLARLRPFVIHISNEPVRCDQDIQDEQRGKQAAFGEALSPLWALLNARPARGFQARDALLQHVRGPQQENYVHFALWELDTSLPLGWVLSAVARENMKKQLGFATEDESEARKSRCKGESEVGLQERTMKAVEYNRAAMKNVMSHLRALPQ